MKSLSQTLRIAAICLAVVGITHQAGAQTSIKTNIWTGFGGAVANTNWSFANNWTNNAALTNGAPTPVSTVMFTNAAAVASQGQTNNTVDANLTISNLLYANWTLGSPQNYQVTAITNGVTLTVANGMTVGTSTDPGASTIVNGIISGAGGKLNVTGGNIIVRQGTATGTIPRPGWAMLDMSQLDTFTATITRLLVAGDGAGSAFNSRETAIVYLAKTNIITASGTGSQQAIIVAVNNSNGAGGNTAPTNVPSYLYLGVTNSIYADSMKIGADKCAGSMLFNPAFTSSGTPAVLIRGASGTRMGTLSVADHSALGSSNQRSFGLADFSGGTVDAMINLIYVGRGNNGNNTGTDGRPSATGILTLSGGKVDVNNVEVGYQNASGNTGYNANGTVNVNGGVLVVNQTMELSHNSGSGTTAGTLNINGGTVLANFITTGGGTNNIAVNNGTLSITNAVGTPAIPVSVFSITNSTLNLYLVGSTNIVANTLNIGASAVTVNITALPGIAVYPATNALVNWTNVVNGDPTLFTLGALPSASPSYGGYLVTNLVAKRIDLVLTNGPIGVPPMPQKTVTWNGVTNGTFIGVWDSVTTNWVSGGVPTNYANQTTIPFQGDFVVFNDSLKGTATVNLPGSLTPGNLTVNNSLSNYVFTGLGRLSGAVTLAKSGSGSLTLTESGGDNFNGGVSVNGGTLVLGNAGSIISGDSTIGANGTLQIGNNDAGGNVPAGNFTNNGALVFNRSDSALTVGTAITGAGSLANNGSGTVTVTATCSFTGPTVANAGTLALQGANGAASTISSSSGLTINNGGTVLVNSDNSLGNPATGAGIPVTVNAGGTLTGNQTSSHLRGQLTLSGGTLAMGGTEVANQINNGSWDLHLGLIVNGGINASTISALDVIPLQTGGTIFDVANGGTPGGIDLNVTGTLTFGATAAQRDTGVIKNGDGTMALDNNNTYTNGTLINSGALQLGEAGDVAPLTFPLGTGGVTNNALLNIASSQSVTVSNIISGTGALWVSRGTGILAGADTYTGNTVISNGILQFAGAGTIANSPVVTIINGLLGINGNISVSSAVNFTNGTLKVTAALNVANISLVTATVNGSGAGTTNFIQAVNIPPIPAYPQVFPVIQYTTLNGGVSHFAPIVPAGYSGYISNDVSGKLVDLVLTNGPVTPFLAWFGASGGVLNSTWDFAATDWSNTVTHVLAPYQDGSLVTFSDAGVTNVVNLTTTYAPAGVTVTNSNTYTFVGVGGIGGTNGLTKLGTGALILDNTGTNTFSGGFTIGAGGTVQMGKFDTAGSLGSGAVSANGALLIARTDNLVLSNSIGGSGAISQLGTNSTLTLSGNNGSFSGTMLVTNNGTLQAGSASALGGGTAVTTIASGSSLDINGLALGAQVAVLGIGVTNSDGTTNGAIINSSASSAGPPAVKSVTLQGDTVFGAPTEGALACASVMSNRWDIRGTAASLTGAFNITKVSPNQVSISGVTVDPALGNIDVQNGILSIETTTTGLGDPTKTLTVENGATLAIFNATNQFNKNIVLNGNGINNSLGTINNFSGNNNTIGGPMTLSGSVEVTFRTAAGAPAGGALTLAGTMTGVAASLTKEDTNTLILTSVADGHNGGTIINDGTFILNGKSTDTGNTLTINTHTLGVSTTLGGNGTNAGPVMVNDTFWPGVGGTPSTFGSGNMTVAFGNAIFTLGNTTTIGGGVNDLLNVNGNFDGGSSSVQINPKGLLSVGGTYRLVNFTGSRSGNFSGTPTVVASASPSRYAFTLDQTTAQQVNVTVTTGPGQMVWNGRQSDFSLGNGLWDVQNSQNWTNLNNATVFPIDHQFLQGDQVLLTNAIIASGGTNVLTITTNSPVLPSSITVNSTTNYTIQGPGTIAGTMNLTKAGSSTLQINNANTFVGTVTISGGTLLVNNANALGSTNNPIIVTNGGALDLGGPSFAANANPLIGYRLLMLSGFGTNTSLGPVGANHNGCLINTGPTTQENAAQNVLLTGDTAIGNDAPINTAGRFDLGRVSPAYLSTGGHAYNLYKVGTNQISLVGVAVDTNLANIDIQGGELGIERDTGLGDPAYTVTVESGATLEFFQAAAVLNKHFVVNGGSLAEGVEPNIWFNNGAGYPTNTLVGPVIVTNGTVVIGGGGSGAISNAISGPSAVTFAGNVLLTGTNTYTGNTIISNNTLSLAGTASINNTTNIAIQSGATMNVAERVDDTLTLQPWQILSGKGRINGNLTNLVGSISLASTNGTFTVSNNATLGGNFTNQLDRGSNTVFVVGGNLVYGGTLTVTTNAASTTTLTAGTSYKLFRAVSYTGTFSSVTLPALPDGLAWTNGLAVDGTIGIVPIGVPVFTHTPGALLISLNGANINVTGTNGDANSLYYLLATTNIADLKSAWLTVATNVVGSVSGPTKSFTFIGTNVVVPADAQQFYLLSNTNAVH